MTSTDGEARVRRLINQTDSSNTQFASAMIQELLNQGRRMMAVRLPDNILLNLRAYENTVQSITSGYLAYLSDFLRPLTTKVVKIGTTNPPTTIASQIKKGEEWRIRFLENNDLTASGTDVKYYRETGAGIECYPSSDTTIIYPYLRKPDDLTVGGDNDLPGDVEDMTVDFAFEKLMGTSMGDLELASFLAKSRGYMVREVKK